MARRLRRNLRGRHAPVRPKTQTSILKKTIKRKKAKAQSRLSREAGLLQRGVIVFSRACSILAPIGYVFAVLVLFQFVSVRLVLGFYENALAQSSDQVSAVAQEKKSQADASKNVGTPVRLKIPALRVNAVIRSVGLMPDGSMGVPKLPRDTAWYMLGPKPGETGSAVIAGHVNWLYGATGVFAHIKSLKPGDLITVQDNHGANTPFVVREIRAFGQKDDASDVFRSYDGKSHLNLVTCSGIWDKAARIYSKRLVVFADKVGD